MKYAAIQYLKGEELTGLLPSERSVLTWIIIFGSMNSVGNCWAGLDTLATLTGNDEHTVRTAIGSLCGKKLISKARRHDPHGHRQTDSLKAAYYDRVRVKWQALEARDRVAPGRDEETPPSRQAERIDPVSPPLGSSAQRKSG